MGRLGLTKPEGVEDPLFFLVFFFVSQLFDGFIGANWEKLALLTSQKTIHLSHLSRVRFPAILLRFFFHHPLRARAMNTRSLNIFNMDSVLLLPLPALGGQGFQRRPAPPNSIWKVQNVPPIPGWKAWQKLRREETLKRRKSYWNWWGSVLGTERPPKKWIHSTF